MFCQHCGARIDSDLGACSVCGSFTATPKTNGTRPMYTAKCPYCKAGVAEDAQFCSVCGYRLVQQDSLPQSTAPKTEKEEPSLETARYLPIEFDEYGGEKGRTISGFVCSMIGLVTAPLIMGIIGLILSRKAMKGGSESGLARAGQVIGIIDIGIGIIAIIAAIIMIGNLKTMIEEYQAQERRQQYQQERQFDYDYPNDEWLNDSQWFYE